MQRTAQELNPGAGPKALRHCCHHPSVVQGADGHAHQVANVTVLVDGETGRSSFGGLLRCGNPWTCPVCAAKIAKERQEVLATLLDAHLQLGPDDSGALFITFTIRHDVSMRFKDLKERRALLWKKMRAGYTWKRLQRLGGYLGDVRAIEVTIGEQHGWHPHDHLTVFLDHQATEQERAELEEALFLDWRKFCLDVGLPAPERFAVREGGGVKGLGVNVENVLRDQGPAVAEYMASGGLVSPAADSASAEATGWMAKEARGSNRSIMQLLQDVHERREVRDVLLWKQWAASINRMRQFSWSKGRWDIRERYGLRVREDEEIAADEEQETKTAVAEIGSGVYRFFSRVPGWRARVLELAEQGGGLAVLQFVRRCIDTFNGRSPPAWYQEELRL